VGSLALVYGGFLVLAPLCALAQHFFPDRTAPPVLDRSRRIDWLYWLITPLFTGVITRAATLTFAATIALALDGRIDPRTLLTTFHARSPIGEQPLWLQAIEALLIADFLSYWSHRIRHRGLLWKFHAVHHSPKQLDWLAAARMHPLDDLLDNVVVGLPILVLGFDPIVFLSLDPLLLLHTLYLHMGVRWDLGPLRYVIASPAFHRWHHAADEDAVDRNFAGVLSLWDVLFGTFRLPRVSPQAFGTPHTEVPETLRGQLWEPIARLVRG
jgi:sterol desaturase/sphingolipid hydroxylase (fatty acid hydroxylase superfamily)